MTGQLIWAPTLIDEILNGQYSGLREERQGICLHYDGRGSDRGSMQWFAAARCKLSFNLLVPHARSFVRIAPDTLPSVPARLRRPSRPRRLPAGSRARRTPGRQRAAVSNATSVRAKRFS